MAVVVLLDFWDGGCCSCSSAGEQILYHLYISRGYEYISSDMMS